MSSLRSRGPNRRLDAATTARIIEAYERQVNMTVAEIGRLFGLSRATVYLYLKRSGVETHGARKNGSAPRKAGARDASEEASA